MRKRINNRAKLDLAIIFLAVVCIFSSVGQLAAQESDSSSACIKCHTNYQAMDSYGAKAAAGSAAIAG